MKTPINLLIEFLEIEQRKSLDLYKAIGQPTVQGEVFALDLVKEKAKELLEVEKKVIVDAYDSAIDQEMNERLWNGEDYFNNTFNNNKTDNQ